MLEIGEIIKLDMVTPSRDADIQERTYYQWEAPKDN